MGSEVPDVVKQLIHIAYTKPGVADKLFCRYDNKEFVIDTGAQPNALQSGKLTGKGQWIILADGTKKIVPIIKKGNVQVIQGKENLVGTRDLCKCSDRPKQFCQTEHCQCMKELDVPELQFLSLKFKTKRGSKKYYLKENMLRSRMT